MYEIQNLIYRNLVTSIRKSKSVNQPCGDFPSWTALQVINESPVTAPQSTLIRYMQLQKELLNMSSKLFYREVREKEVFD